MTKIIFLTSGQIDYILPNCSLYESIERVAMGKDFPHLVKNGESKTVELAKLLMKHRPDIIFSAPSAQAKETADIIAKELNLEIHLLEELLPLRFSLRSLLSKKKFRKLGDNKFVILRSKFLDSFFKNNLIDKNIEIERRFRKIKKLFLERFSHKTVIVVSHAYLIKLFSIYYTLGKEMFRDRKKLFEMFQPRKEPLGRLETLEITI